MVDETPFLKNPVICGTPSLVSQFSRAEANGSAIDPQFFRQLNTLASLMTLNNDLLVSLSADFPIDADDFPALTTFCPFR